MRYRNRFGIMLLLLFWTINGWTVSRNYGLYFQSYSVPADQRTTLFLDDDKAFSFNENFTVTFQMQIRNKLNYGSIMGLHTGDGQDLFFALVGKEDSHLIPALIYKGKIIEIQTVVKHDEWFPVSIQIDKKQNTIGIRFNQKDTILTSPLPDIKSVAVRFGKLTGYETDIVAMNVKDVTIVQDRKQTRHWMLKNHNENICYDEIEGAIARANYPRWVLDQYTEWQEIYSGTTDQRFDIAFNERDALFYMVYPEKIVTLNALTGSTTEMKVEGGYPAIEYHNHLLYDTLSNQLISYFQTEQRVSYFSFDTRRWSLETKSAKMADDYNHARAYNPADSSYYFFGGYGFHHYHNRLCRLKVGDTRIEEVAYDTPIDPRFSASASVVDGKLYIFGGRGNEQGRQELGTVFYSELYAIDLKSGKTQLLWKKTPERKDELTSTSSSMIFNPEDHSFYTVSLKAGGSLWRIPMKAEEEWQAVGKPIANNLIHQDYDLSYYYSLAHQKMFVVMDKIMSDGQHRFFIYSIDTPLIQEADTLQRIEEAGDDKSDYYYMAGAVCLILCLCVVYYLRRKSAKSKAPMPEIPMSVLHEEPLTAKEEVVDDAGKEEVSLKETTVSEEEKVYFDRSRSTISLLGTFYVRDKEGRDTTASFTPLLKSFLSLLILHSQTEQKGIPVKLLNEILWMDKDELSVRNNRNVALRKLRVLLAEVGDINIIKESGFLRIEFGEDVFCDYQTVCNYMKDSKASADDNKQETYVRILELLLYGPLLQDLRFDWLDDFKADYSNVSIDWLDNLLAIEEEKRNVPMILRIADTMFLHDPLNEKALSAKCRILYASDKKGLAKKAYDNFAKEYKEMLGEEYKTPFGDLISREGVL
ncbi:Kelch repeat-containing protein [Bacteroides ovatus]|uniref:DNA-binding transcriptional activator of the SARP family n=1 Tax=Bacteroides ovatus TaxID=28116 RepID=A0A1G8CP20_BACOV|nr:kelch repeat-containing protein [Bacteroides ovatus]SDH47166.1 DNA-binding transcriptional activator of the SARP family [Bacteroides ovatus]